jgi:hypothetical protein
MFVTNFDLTPPKEILDKCFQIQIRHESNIEPGWKMKKWASAHCESFVWMDLQYLAVKGILGDTYTFYFANEADKIMFALKYN